MKLTAVGRAGITINLNGHTIRAPGGSSSHDGIFNDGFGRVTIENGTIQNFEYGIFEQATHGSKILNATVHGSSEAGILYQYSRGGVIKHAGVFGTRQGIYLLGNFAVDVSDSVANHNLIYGLYDYNSADTVSRVTASSNDDYGFYAEYWGKGRHDHAMGNGVQNCLRVRGCS